MRPRVILVTGSFPPDVCGIGDYTQSLAKALDLAGLPVEVFCHRRWGIGGTMAALRRLLEEKNSLIHIQYPAMGYGESIGPQLCALIKNSVITLHEFSFAHSLRKLSLLPFTLRSRYLVMTSEFERKSLTAKMPWADGRMRVIPIGSNIPSEPIRCRDRTKRIAYFGLIMPHKGLEDFIEFSKFVRAAGLNWELAIIGMIPPKHAGYAKAVMNAIDSLHVDWILNRSPLEVSELLSHTALGYLPFPDGASERRGSLKAALASGVACITTRTEQTPAEMAGAVLFASSPPEAFKAALRLMDMAAERECLSQNAVAYSRSFSWETIAQAHVQLYSELTPLGEN